MNLLIISTKVIYNEKNKSIYWTDGSFSIQIETLSELFNNTKLICPIKNVDSIMDGYKKINFEKLGVVKNIRFIRFKNGIIRKLIIIPWFIIHLKILLKEIKNADVIHTPLMGDIGILGMILALLFRKRLFTRHCGNWNIQNTFFEKVVKNIFENFGSRRSIMFVTGGASIKPSAKNRYIHWIHSSALKKEEMVYKPKILRQSKTINLIFVGRLTYHKRAQELIKSVPLINNLQGVRLTIVGEGEYKSNLKKLVYDMNLEDRVEFTGFLSKDNVMQKLSENDIFCFPSTASEGFPKAVLEALTVGLPCVTSNVSVLPLLIGKKCGIIVDQPFSNNIADAINKLIRNNELYNLMSIKAINSAQNYTIEEWKKNLKLRLTESWGNLKY